MKSRKSHTFEVFMGMEDKCVGISKVGEKGQIVIPNQVRKMFNINPGDSLIF